MRKKIVYDVQRVRREQDGSRIRIVTRYEGLYENIRSPVTSRRCLKNRRAASAMRSTRCYRSKRLGNRARATDTEHVLRNRCRWHGCSKDAVVRVAKDTAVGTADMPMCNEHAARLTGDRR
jgi:hypothetical protein